MISTRMYMLLCLIALTSIVPVTLAQSLDSEFLAGSRPIIVAFASSQDETTLLVATKRELWKSSDAGNTWDDITEGLRELSNYELLKISDLQAWDENADTLFAHIKYEPAHNWELVISEDGGITWRALDLGLNYHWGTFLCIQDRTDHDHLIHVTHREVHHSYDFGHTWSQAQQYDPEIAQKYKLMQDDYSPNTLWLAGWAQNADQPGGVHRSDDMGETWTPLITDPHGLTGYYLLQIQDIVQIDSLTLVVPVSTGRLEPTGAAPKHLLNLLLLTEDRGETWQVLEDRLPEKFGPSYLVQDGNNPNTFHTVNFIHRMAKGVYTTSDLSQPFELHNGFDDGYKSTRFLTQNMFNGNVYVGMNGAGLFRLDGDGGEAEEMPIPIGFGRAQSIFPHGDELFSVGTNDEVQERYSFITQEWSIMGLEREEDGYLLRTPFVDDEENLLCIGYDWYTEEAVRFAVFQYDTNQGSWERISDTYTDLWSSIEDDYPFPLLNHGTYDWCVPVYSVNGAGIIVRDRETSTWTQLPQITDPGYYLKSITNGINSIYALAYYGDVFVSSIVDPAWSPLQFPDYTQLDPHSPIDYQNGQLYLVGVDNFYSYDGSVWSGIPLPSEWRMAAFCPDQPGRVALWDNESQYLFLSDDLGQSWLEIAVNWPEEFAETTQYTSQMEFNGPDDLLLCTALGVVHMDLTLVSVAPEEPITTYEFSLSVYPNPFNPSTTVRYTLPQPARVNVAVHDLLGRRVAILANEWRFAGEHMLIFDGSGMASGTYFLRVSSSTGLNTSQKLVLIK